MAHLSVNSSTSSSYLVFHWEKGFMFPVSFLPVMGTSFSVCCHRCSVPISTPAKQDLTLNPNAYVKIILNLNPERGQKHPSLTFGTSRAALHQMHQNSTAESDRRLSKCDPFHTAFRSTCLCCHLPVHDSSIPVCQPGPLDTKQTDSQNLTVTLSRVYRNRWTQSKVTFTKHSTFIWLLWWVTWLHAGNSISSLENNMQNIQEKNEVKTFSSFYRCCDAPTAEMSALFVHKICEPPGHSPINSHFQRKWDWLQHFWLEESSPPSLSQDLTPPFGFPSMPEM